ncbi:putative Ig domain-containing protein [Cupriavidus gilardii]|uniref:kelch repeat-containing protein n=1 Tax=Cupriavidus gilardii TaxID=82541 RepID=UPI001ABE8A2A|nr:kelch repeat-containing protein [Cupriavidus gilardii]MBO4122178.1 putative Ig domain-containing protein [Cupriavidus gilardii]
MTNLLGHAAIPPRRQLPRPGQWLLLLSLCFLSLLSACGGDDDDDKQATTPIPTQQAPAGISYGMSSVVYEVDKPIVPNRPSASGGAVERYSIAPALPAGLVLDAVTGVISGTPTAVAPSTVHVVTAENGAGSATARVQIEVRKTAVAPSQLAYREPAVVYTVGEPIVANGPSNGGGPIDAYAITPALPAGLLFDTRTGVINGTPTAAAAEASYTVTGRNAGGQTTVTLRIAVEAAIVAPSSLAYSSPAVLYVAGEAIVPNAPIVAGGAAASFTVSPALPTGLSLNAQSGVIAGTPTTIQSEAVYTITASNRAGSTDAQVRIAVTGRGSWVAASSMPTALHYLTATTLLNGKVLVASGHGTSGPTGAAFLYDPATNLWAATANMANARYEATATRLKDGRVLVVGGSDSPSAEIYDPATGTWQAAASLAQGRTRHTATLLPDGKVLVIGGTTGGTGVVSTAERYDPATNTWTQFTTSLAYPRGQHAATLLPGGTTMLVVGGIGPIGSLPAAELFPVNDTGTSAPVPFPGGASVIASSELLSNGKVLVTGMGSTAWLYDPVTSTWTSSAMNAARALATMTRLADGRVLVAGGGNSVRLASAEIYNPDANVWTVAASMSVARSAGAATLLLDGSVLMVGGSSNSSLDAVERYRP